MQYFSGAKRAVAMAVRSAVPLVVLLAASAANANPTLSFSSYAQVYASLYSNYSSPLLGDTSLYLGLPSDYRGLQAGATTTGVATRTYNLPAGSGGTGDALYDIVTSNGQYGFSYTGTAETDGLKLRTAIQASTVDINGSLASSPNTSLNSTAHAYWNQQFYIAPTAARAAGTYGAILVRLDLDGHFPGLSDPTWSNSANAQVTGSSSFTDSAGVSYQSSFSVYAAAGDQNWTGSTTVYKKLLFQYGTPFNISLEQYASAWSNGSADFFNTGKITSIELPYGATLDSGAQQFGLGGVGVYGTVFNSLTVDAQNTNWDFGNNGGGFTPQVPEPSSVVLMLAGLAALGFMVRRRI